MDQLPNLAIISEVIPQASFAGPLLLYRLLKDYPQDKILVIGPQALPGHNLLSCRYQALNLPWERLNRTRFSRLARSLRSFIFLPGFTLGALKAGFGQFKPEVVLSVMQTQPYYYLAYRYAKKENLPLVVIVHDLPELCGSVYPWLLPRQLKRNIQVYRYARKRLCVSHQMRDYLQQAYQTSGDVLYPLPSERLEARPVSDSLALKEPGVLTIGYTGSLWGGYGMELQHLLPVFKEAKAKLRVYSCDSFSLGDDETVTYCGYAAADEVWERVKAECDAVILFYCWPESGYAKEYSLHFPSKLPEYLGLGMPVLIIGPEYATGVKWGLNHPGAAAVVTENNPLAWIRAFHRLKESAALRQGLAREAAVAGRRDFAPQVIRRQFLQALKEAAG
ncbi:MAG: glycosyltransferase [Candidatus Omnitrophota bacterium]|jgi:glycosyltransferase involved in cell wall biosynthesis